MSSVILVRHAEPVLVPERPASQWELSDRGWEDSRALGGRLAGMGIDGVFTSFETKAVETGAAIGGYLRVPVSVLDGLEEQGCDTVPWLEDANALRHLVERHFQEPRNVVMGLETSFNAGQRMARTIEAHKQGVRLPAYVSHGRVIAAYLAALTGQPAWDIWQPLRLPDALVVDLDARSFSTVD